MDKKGNVYNRIVKNINSFRNDYVLTDNDTKNVADILESVSYPEFEENAEAVIKEIKEGLEWDISYPARNNLRLSNGISIKALGKPNRKDKERVAKDLEAMGEKLAGTLLGYGETAELSLCCLNGNPALRLATQEAGSAPILKAFLSAVYSRAEISEFDDSDKRFYKRLYATLCVPFVDEKKDSNKKKSLGQPIQYWGNLNVIKSSGRKPYHDLMDYIFMALVAKTDIDFFALDKGEIEANDVVRQLMTTMEEYINYGLNFIDDKLRDDPDSFFTDTAFLDLFMSVSPTSDDSELESLD